MALIKNYKTKHGVDCNYWRVTEVFISAKNNKLSAQIALYLSKVARNQGADHIIVANYDGELPPVGIREHNDIVKLAYNAIKLQPEFTGAIDD